MSATQDSESSASGAEHIVKAQEAAKKSLNDDIASIHKDLKRESKNIDLNSYRIHPEVLLGYHKTPIQRRCSEGNLPNGLLTAAPEIADHRSDKKDKERSRRDRAIAKGLSVDVASDGYLENRVKKHRHRRRDISFDAQRNDSSSDHSKSKSKQTNRSLAVEHSPKQSGGSRRSSVMFDLGEVDQESSHRAIIDQEKRHMKKQEKRRRRSSIQPGVVIDASSLHKQNGILCDDKESVSVHGNPVSSSKSQLQNLTLHLDKECLSPVGLTATSPSPSQISTESNEAGYESACSSLYLSSYLYPPEFQPNSKISSRSIQNNRRLSTPAVLPHQSFSSQGPARAVSAPQSARSSPYRSSVANEDKQCSTPPYVRIGENSSLPRTSDIIHENDMQPSSLICHSTLGNICGTEGTEEKEISDQTCRSNFGMVLSGICFVLFLWYLAVVYKSFLDKALSFDTYEGIYTPKISPVQEVVIHISMEDFNIVPQF